MTSPQMTASQRPRTHVKTITCLAFDGMQTLDAVGPLEVFATANELSGRSHYTLRILSPDGKGVRSTSGIRLDVDGPWTDAKPNQTLLVPGGDGIHALLQNPNHLATAKRILNKTARIASVCTGAFLLAKLGFLDGRRAATHWAKEADLRRLHPRTHVECDHLHVVDGVWTSAGVCAGMDLALALLEEDTDVQLAHDVARWLVLFARRYGDEPQHGPVLRKESVNLRAVARIRGYIANHPARDLRVATLAARVAMSPRNFSRCFSKEVGLSVGRYVRASRVKAARRLLAQGASQDEAATQSGLGTRQNLARALHQASEQGAH